MKVLLIDGNNLAHRVHWTHKHLTCDDMPVSLLYGFFRSLVSFKKKFPAHLCVVVWDGGYKRREAESKKAVNEGIIPSGYKENREEEPPPEVEDLFKQMPLLKEALKLVRVLQVRVDGVEADDIINTYAQQNNGGETVIVTSDQDFYQLLSDSVIIFDAMKNNYWTKESFVDTYGFDPKLWVDCGALMGDSSDNIHGVPGIGEKWATKFVKQFGDIDGVLKGLAEKKKRGKKEQAVLDNEPRLRLAKSLKKMDEIDNLPAFRCRPREKGPLLEWFSRLRFESLKMDAWRLV